MIILLLLACASSFYFHRSFVRSRPPAYSMCMSRNDDVIYTMNRFKYVNATLTRLRGLTLADILYVLRKLDVLESDVFDAIVHNWYYEIDNLTFEQEVIIQHCLIYQHGLNLKTRQLEKFPSNTHYKTFILFHPRDH